MSTTTRLRELTPKSLPRVFFNQETHRIMVTYPDSLLLLCADCGGALSVVLHKLPSECHIPSLKQCECKPRLRTLTPISRGEPLPFPLDAKEDY